MWLEDPPPDTWLVTANSVVRSNGRLVMGAGAALQAKERFPDCDEWFGSYVRGACGSGGFFGVIWHPEEPIGLFQTKYHWRQTSSYDLIYRSASVLIAYLATSNSRISLNFPGIGEGGLDKERVKDLVIDYLPDNVTVWEWSEEYQDA